MANTSFAKFFAIFVLLIFVANFEMTKVEGKLCSKYSETWSGVCIFSSHCDRQCRKWEGAKHGACHKDKRGFACFCYFNCK